MAPPLVFDQQLSVLEDVEDGYAAELEKVAVPVPAIMQSPPSTYMAPPLPLGAQQWAKLMEPLLLAALNPVPA